MPTKIHARCVRVCAAVLALVLVAWRPATAQEPIEIKAGISDPVNTVLAWYMARDAGLYAAQGLKVDIVNMSGARARAPTTLLSRWGKSRPPRWHRPSRRRGGHRGTCAGC